MKKILCICLFAGLFIYTSCSNLFENSVNKESSSRQKSSKKQTELESSEVKYATLSGTFDTRELTGALPSRLLSLVNASGEAGVTASGRSAKPSLPVTSDYEYYIKALSPENKTIEKAFSISDGLSNYSIALPIDIKWTFEAGLRSKADKKQLLLDSETLAGKAFSKTFSDTKLNETHSFILQPLTDGKGSIKLMMKKVPADVKELKILDSSGKNWLNGAVTIGLSISDDNENYIKASDVKPGIYDVTFIFYREYSGLGNIKLPAYISYQTISVFANMETDTWVRGNTSSADQIINSSGEFELTDTLISSFMETTLYVGKPSQLVSGAQVANPDDNNAGTPYAPLRSFEGALMHIEASCKGTAYQIFISSQQKKAGGFTIPDSITTSVASSITICGLGSNRAVLDADNNGSVLTVDSPVPITLKNIQLTGGNADDGGGIHMKSGTSVTLEAGALVGKDVEKIAKSDDCGNKAAYKGGGIYNHNGTLVLKNGSKVCNNFVISSGINNSGFGGGGISLYGGSLTIEDGAVISWNKCEAARGGGILVPDGDENNVSTLTMTGGEISHNEAKQYGGGVMIGHTGQVSLIAGSNFPAKTFNFSGGKISENTISQKSANAPMAGGAGIFLDGGDFTMSGNAVIEENTAELSDGVGCGGGISISASAEETGTFSMQGGTIRNNSAKEGGAIYFDDGSYQSGNYTHHSCSYSISGAAAIPYGVNGTQGEGKNDVYVGKTGSINISAALDNSFPETGISTAQDNWTRGKIILKIADGVNVTQTLIEKFKCLFPTEDWEKISSTTQVTVNCPFYVGSYNGTQGNDDTNEGTKVSPYATILKACQQMNDADTDYIIKITGTTAAVQQIIPDTLSTSGTYKAKSVSIIGVDNATYPPVINRGLINSASEGSDSGSALEINSTVPVTITNVKITGGWTTYRGGGISLNTTGTLSLGDGVLITGNRSDTVGGGVYTENGTVFIYGSAKIGQRPADKVSSAPVANSEIGNCANWAGTYGGGIYVSRYENVVGKIYLGYYKDFATNAIKKDENFSGGIYYNYAVNGGGAICASGVDGKNSVVQISGGTIAYNYAGTRGGGIYNNYGNIELYGGTIKENNSAAGGAISFSNGSMAFKGSLSIPCGTGTISQTNPLNDICITKGKTISLDSNFTRNSSSETIALTPETPGKNITLLTGSVSTTNIGYFSLKSPGFKFGHVEESTNHYGKTSLKNIVTRIYVKASGTNPSGNTISDTTWNNATYAYNEYTNNQSKPFETIEKALQFITYQGSASNYTIYIDGEIKGLQTIESNSDTNNPITMTTSYANKITLQGNSGYSTDILNGDKQGGDAVDNGSTLTINTAIPIHITKLGIKGGNTTGNGGGINITNTSAKVYIQDKVRIYSNTAAGNGGGIYHNCSELFIYDDTVIGKDDASSTMPTSDPATGYNKAAYGGGIYCSSSGKLYLGYSTASSMTDWSGGIYYNWATTNGGGICSAGGDIYMSAGTIRYNRAGTTTYTGCGGGIYSSGPIYLCKTATIGYLPSSPSPAEQTDNSNTASYGGGIYSAGASVNLGYKKSGSAQELTGGVYRNYSYYKGAGIYCSGSSVDFKTGNISYNVTYTGANTSGGGGLYVEGDSGSVTMSGGTIASNKSYAGGGIYSTRPLTMSGGTIGDSSQENPADAGSTNNYSNYAGYYGGGVYLNYASNSVSASFTGGTIAYNTANQQGGGIYATSSTTEGKSSVDISNTLKNNYADKNGGGIYTNQKINCTLEDATFTTNKSKNGGGAVYMNGSTNSIIFKDGVSMASTEQKLNDIYISGNMSDWDSVLTIGEKLNGSGIITGLDTNYRSGGMKLMDKTESVSAEDFAAAVKRFKLYIVNTNYSLINDGTIVQGQFIDTITANTLKAVLENVKENGETLFVAADFFSNPGYADTISTALGAGYTNKTIIIDIRNSKKSSYINFKIKWPNVTEIICNYDQLNRGGLFEDCTNLQYITVYGDGDGTAYGAGCTDLVNTGCTSFKGFKFMNCVELYLEGGFMLNKSTTAVEITIPGSTRNLRLEDRESSIYQNITFKYTGIRQNITNMTVTRDGHTKAMGQITFNCNGGTRKWIPTDGADTGTWEN